MNKEKNTTSFWKVATVTFFLIVMISAVIPTIMLWSGFDGYFKLGMGEFYMFMINNTEAEMTAGFNLLPAIVGGCIAGALYTILERR